MLVISSYIVLDLNKADLLVFLKPLSILSDPVPGGEGIMSSEENYIRLGDIPQEVWITVGVVGCVLLSYCLCMRQGYSDNWIGSVPPGPTSLPFIGEIKQRSLTSHLISVSRLSAPPPQVLQCEGSDEQNVPPARQPGQVLCLQDQDRPDPQQGLSRTPRPGQHHWADPPLHPAGSRPQPAHLTLLRHGG